MVVRLQSATSDSLTSEGRSAVFITWAVAYPEAATYLPALPTFDLEPERVLEPPPYTSIRYAEGWVVIYKLPEPFEYGWRAHDIQLLQVRLKAFAQLAR